MIDPHVRPGVPSDAGELARLEALGRRGLHDARGGRRWLEEHPVVGAEWPTRLARGGVFVAELTMPPATVGVAEHAPAVIVGFLAGDLGGDVARVEQVFVEPAARELGFGDALLATAVEAARAAGARVLEAEALPGDRETKNLYERAGITARLITVSTPL